MHQLQAEGIKNGHLWLGLDATQFLFLDSTYFDGKLYMSWGIIPGLVYTFLDFVYPLGNFPKSLLYLLHINILIFGIYTLLKEFILKNSERFIIFLFIASSPFISYYFSGDISTIKITSLYSLTYFVWALYFCKKEKQLLMNALLLICILTKFSYLPFACLVTTGSYFKSRRRIYLLSLPIFLISLMFVNFLKFDDFFFWGERFNKFQGEWFTIFKTLQIDTHSFSSYLWSIVDAFKAVFINQGETFFVQSLTISQVTSSAIVPIFLGIFVIIKENNYFKKEEKWDSLIILSLFVVGFCFQVLFQRFYSLRTLDFIFISGMLFLITVKKMKKTTFLPLAVISIISVLSIETTRNNVTKDFSLEIDDDLIASPHYTSRSEYNCLKISSMSKREREVLTPGVNKDCSIQNAMSFVLNTEDSQKRCHVSLKISGDDINCQDFTLITRRQKLFGLSNGESCRFNLKSQNKHDFYYIIYNNRQYENWWKPIATMEKVQLSCL